MFGLQYNYKRKSPSGRPCTSYQLTYRKESIADLHKQPGHGLVVLFGSFITLWLCKESSSSRYDITGISLNPFFSDKANKMS